METQQIYCGFPETHSSRPSSSKNTMEEYNTAMKKMMRNPYEYHHDLGQSRNFPTFTFLKLFLYLIGDAKSSITTILSSSNDMLLKLSRIRTFLFYLTTMQSIPVASTNVIARVQFSGMNCTLMTDDLESGT
ncbi:hypothetical protein DVH24_024415 [Malus domestica]|uniref:Uncharacterized protein n=1 Tax=Malus domestica TaxID=3750 RepID=A0A498JN30_MALDO|nr:hypothetical protein DVH24_024415 [Malus domestica]